MLAVLMLSGLVAFQSPVADGHLNLTLTSVDSLPDGFEAAGASYSPTGALLVWSSRSPLLLYSNSSTRMTRMEFPSNQAPIAVGFENDTVIDILASSMGRVLRTTVSEPRTFVEYQLQLPEDSLLVTTAVRMRGAWCVATQNRSGVLAIYSVLDAGGSTKLASFHRSGYSKQLPDSLAQLGVHLSEAAGGCIVSMWWAPFESFWYTVDGVLVEELRPPADSLNGTGPSGGQTPALIALPLLPVDSGFIQTISDLRSDDRILLLYPPQRERIRRIVLHSPIGFFATYSPTRTILGMRATDAKQLLIYHWSWGEGNTNQPRSQQ